MSPGLPRKLSAGRPARPTGHWTMDSGEQLHTPSRRPALLAQINSLSETLPPLPVAAVAHLHRLGGLEQGIYALPVLNTGSPKSVSLGQTKVLAWPCFHPLPAPRGRIHPSSAPPASGGRSLPWLVAASPQSSKPVSSHLPLPPSYKDTRGCTEGPPQ